MSPCSPLWGRGRFLQSGELGASPFGGRDAPCPPLGSFGSNGTTGTSLKEFQIHVQLGCLRVKLSPQKVGTHPHRHEIIGRDGGRRTHKYKTTQCKCPGRGRKETQTRVSREDAGFQVRVGWEPKLARGKETEQGGWTADKAGCFVSFHSIMFCFCPTAVKSYSRAGGQRNFSL